MNIVVQIILKGLKENGYDSVITTSSDPVGPSAELKEYAFAVESDPVSELHRGLLLCVACLDGLAALAQIILIPGGSHDSERSERFLFLPCLLYFTFLLVFGLSFVTTRFNFD